MWLTVKELSGYLKIKEKTLYALAMKGLLPHYKIGRLIRFKQADVNAWIETKRVESLEIRIDKSVSSLYTANVGRPGHLKERKVG